MVKGWFSFLTQLVIKRDGTKLVSSVQKEKPAATIETSCDFIAGACSLPFSFQLFTRRCLENQFLVCL
jgi:hypothetical protein